jgi:hypothetical protein
MVGELACRCSLVGRCCRCWLRCRFALASVALATGWAGAPLFGLPCVGIRPGRPDSAGSVASTSTARSPPDRVQPRPGRTGGFHPRRAGRACDRSPCPPCRAGVPVGGEKHSLFLKRCLASTGHRGRVGARGRQCHAPAGLTRTAGQRAGAPSRDRRARRLRRRELHGAAIVSVAVQAPDRG